MALALSPLSMFAQTPDEVISTARNANDFFMNKYADPTEPTFVKKVRPSSLWTRAVYYEGLMALYDIDPQQRYLDYTDRWANFHQWTPRNGTNSNDADDQCCEQTYLMRFQQTQRSQQKNGTQQKIDSTMIRPTLINIAQQMQTKIGWWTWIDAIQMGMPVYAQLTEITGNRAYITHGMKMYRWSRNECGGGLFNEKEGLWWRDADYVPPYQEKDGNNCYWSRGNGWVYAALVRCMNALPKKDAYYQELRKDFMSMSIALMKCQREDGFWNVSLSSPTTYGGKETTGTSLFLYGMAWGINQGYLKAKIYRPVIDKAWQAMERDAVHNDGFLGYVQGTGKDPSAGQPLSYDKVPDFDDYGVGCFLLAASEYYKLLKNQK